MRKENKGRHNLSNRRLCSTCTSMVQANIVVSSLQQFASQKMFAFLLNSHRKPKHIRLSFYSQFISSVLFPLFLAVLIHIPNTRLSLYIATHFFIALGILCPFVQFKIKLPSSAERFFQNAIPVVWRRFEYFYSNICFYMRYIQLYFHCNKNCKIKHHMC